MKVAKDTPKIEVTRWMKIKAQMEIRKKLTKDFLKKFFGIRELVYVHFEYETQRLNKDGEVDKHRLPEKDTSFELAWISRSTPIEKVKAMFNVKPQTGRVVKLLGAKIVPVGKLRKV